jgi:GT2 family glycosyltransferase
MKKEFSQIKVIIVTFESDLIIYKTLKSLKRFKVYLVENSNNKKFKKKIESKFKNVTCFLSGTNIGYGSAINLALKRTNAKYYLILNPDCIVSEKTILELRSNLENENDIDVVAPITIDKKNRVNERYGYFISSKIKKKNFENIKFKQVDFVIGCIFLIKSKIFKKIGLFDENFFMNYEEIDFFKRLRNSNYNIFINKKNKAKHLEGMSSFSKKNKFRDITEYNKISKWHLAWGKFYYYNKHYNFFITLIICLSFLFKSFCQYLYFTFTNQKSKKEIAKAFISGILNSFIGRKSFKRPFTDHPSN